MMLSTANLLSPADGSPVVAPTQDMVLGCYYLTMDAELRARRQEARSGSFATEDEAILAYQLREKTGADAPRADRRRGPDVGRRDRATPARAPRGRPSAGSSSTRSCPTSCATSDKVMKRADLKELVDECYRLLGAEETAHLVDGIKSVGFEFATRGGMTIGLFDIEIPKDKAARLDDGRRRGRRDRPPVPARPHHRGRALRAGRRRLAGDDGPDVRRDDEVRSIPTGPVTMMTASGARGNKGNIGQLGAMRGLMADPSGRIIDVPVRSNFREGMTVLEYFISTHGARKGLADTALRTADSGYLTRRLVDVAQDVITREDDCGTEEGSWIIRDRVERREGRLPAAARRPACGGPAARSDGQAQEGRGADAPRRAQRADHRGGGGAHRRGRRRRGARPLTAHLRGPLRRLPGVLRPQPRHRRDGRLGRGGRHHRRPVDRRARHAADDADVPHRRRRRPGHHRRPAARRGAVRGPRPQGQGRDQPHRRHRRDHPRRRPDQGQGHLDARSTTRRSALPKGAEMLAAPGDLVDAGQVVARIEADGAHDRRHRTGQRASSSRATTASSSGPRTSSSASTSSRTTPRSSSRTARRSAPATPSPTARSTRRSTSTPGARTPSSATWSRKSRRSTRARASRSTTSTSRSSSGRCSARSASTSRATSTCCRPS